MTTRKKNGDGISPCCTPVSTLKKSIVRELVLIQNCAPSYNTLTMSMSEEHYKCVIFALTFDNKCCQVIFSNQNNLLQEEFGIPQIVQVYFITSRYVRYIVVFF